ncbi:MAG: glycosyltransferase family 4 protein [Micromonosporaceae bacterium]
MTDRGAQRRRSGGALKVALVMATSTGGVGGHVLSLARGLTERGHEVVVCAPSATQQRFGFRVAGARFAPVEIASGPALARQLKAASSLRRVLRAYRASVVHAHGLRAGLLSVVARPRQTPLVVTWHNLMLATGLRGQAYQILEGLVARGADITLGASPDLVERVLRLGGRDVRPGPVAAPVLSEPLRSPEQVRVELGAVDRPLLLTVARLTPQKSLEVLIEAAARWRSLTPQPVVAIAGSGPSEAALKTLADRAGAPVRFLGHRTDVADLLAAADVAVVTSQWEARQLFAQEALAAGVPLVATSVGGVPALVGEAALLTPVGDVDALDAAARKLLENPAVRSDLAKRGKAQAATWPTVSDTLHQVEAVYRELTGVD